MISLVLFLIFAIGFHPINATLTHQVYHNSINDEFTLIDYDSNHRDIIIDIYYNDTVNSKGWAALYINKTTYCNHLSNEKIWFVVGFAEGQLTQKHTWQTWVNTMNPTNRSWPYMDHKIIHWIKKHIKWILENSNSNKNKDEFWKNVNYIMRQLRGFTKGYNHVAPENEKLSFFDLFAMNFQNEIGSVMRAIGYSKEEVEATSYKKGGCSALIRPTDDDLFMAHATWGTYNSMLRIYKDYVFSDVRIAYSGYFGFLSSTDDWYMLGNGLTIQETTMQNSNNKNRKFVIPTSVSEWLRVVVACQIGTDGLSWGNAFKRYNSGTYNNQYMVVNMNLFVPGTKLENLPDNLVWITSQMPGMVPSLDVTHIIRKQGYWASYNLNYLSVLYIASDTNILKDAYGDFFSYTKYSRAKIFKRDVSNVTDLQGMQRIMRYNHWQTDPLSKCPNCSPLTNPMLTIASRGDLIPKNGSWGNWSWLNGPQAFGAIDAKIASYKMFNNRFTSSIISGPTYDNQIPFKWSTSPVRKLPLSASSHLGQSDLQLFLWLDTKKDLF